MIINLLVDGFGIGAIPTVTIKRELTGGCCVPSSYRSGFRRCRSSRHISHRHIRTLSASPSNRQTRVPPAFASKWSPVWLGSTEKTGVSQAIARPGPALAFRMLCRTRWAFQEACDRRYYAGRPNHMEERTLIISEGSCSSISAPAASSS